MSSPSAKVIVLCPMQIERAHIERVLHARSLKHPHVHVVQTGIGKDAIVASARQTLAASADPGVMLILAGACGGLTHVADVPPIATVLDEHGQSWTPHNADPTGVRLVAVDRIVATPADKTALATSSGASIVDMESHAFAAFCEGQGVRWSVVRGVSDTPQETLPHEVLGWITPTGDTRSFIAARDLVLKPRLVPHIIRVVRRSNRVLPGVGHRVAEIAHSWLATPAQSRRMPQEAGR